MYKKTNDRSKIHNKSLTSGEKRMGSNSLMRTLEQNYGKEKDVKEWWK